MLEYNPDYTCVFLSYEETKSSILRKLTNIKANNLFKTSPSDKQFSALTRYLIEGKDYNGETVTKVSQAEDYLNNLMLKEKRLGRPPLDQEKLDAAFKLIEAGISPSQIAKQLSLGRSTLYKAIKKNTSKIP